MILKTEQTITTEVSDYEQIEWHPLNPLRMAYFRLLDMARENGKPTEVFSYRKLESNHTVIGIKSAGLERWE